MTFEDRFGMTSDLTKDAKDVFQVRTELYAPSRLPPKAYELFRTRALVTDVISHQCWLYVVAITRLHAIVNRGGHGLPRIGIVGGGHMGCAIAMTLLMHEYPSHKIMLSTRQPDRLPKCDTLASPTSQALFQSIPRIYDNARLSRECDILILCVPPSQLKSVAIQIKHALNVTHSSCIVISVLCGTAIETLQKACGTRLVLRMVVNVPDLTKRLERSDDNQDNEESTSMTLRQQAELLAAQELQTQFDGAWVASPLARILMDLACRLDRELPASRASETVEMVLRHDATTSSTEDIIDPPMIPSDPTLLHHDQEDITSITGSDPQPSDEVEAHWLMAWQPSLQQLQQVFGPTNEDVLE